MVQWRLVKIEAVTLGITYDKHNIIQDLLYVTFTHLISRLSVSTNNHIIFSFIILHQIIMEGKGRTEGYQRRQA